MHLTGEVSRTIILIGHGTLMGSALAGQRNEDGHGNDSERVGGSGCVLDCWLLVLALCRALY